MRHALLVSAILLLASLPAASGVGTRYATYVGDDGWDLLADMARDDAGNVFVVGKEHYNDARGFLLFVKKYSPEGDLLWRSVIGNTGGTIYPHGLATDGAGNAYVVGFTDGGMPFTGASFQPTNRGETDAFVVQVMANGAWGPATMLGGRGHDQANDVGVDANGNVYVVGETSSCDFPTTSGAYQRILTGCGPLTGGTDAFVTKLRPGFGSLSYSTLLGGSSIDAATTIAVSPSSGSALVGGFTFSPDFDVTSGGLQRTFGGGAMDGFVVKLQNDGRSLLFGTYLGGSKDDGVEALTRDASSNVYVTGRTASEDFRTTPGAHQTAHNGDDGCDENPCTDGFALKLDPYGSTLRYSTLFGGRANDAGYDISLDATLTAFVTGYTISSDFPIIDGRPSQHEHANAFALAVTPKGNALAYSTILGGTDSTMPEAIAARPDGAAWVAGDTDGGFPTTADADRREGSLYEGFLVLLDPPASGLVFAPRGGNEWWVEAALGGREANLVTRVEARDNDTAWTTLPHQAWGAWGGTLHVEPGNDVQYRVTLSNGAVRQSCWYEHPATTCAPAPAFDASFSGVKGNAWWVEARVTGTEPIAAVHATTDGGATWKALTLRSWGAWAASFHVPEGTILQLRATGSSGATDLSGCYRWTAATPVECGGGGGTEPTEFDATFKNVRGNEWWIETDVAVTGGTLAGVDARVNGGAWQPLTKQSWGSWAKSIHAPAGSTVEFRARAADGSTDASSAYRWPPG